VNVRKSVVSIVKGDDVERMVEEALFHLGGVRALIKAGSTVVIKPNAGHLGPPETSVNTNPRVVAAVITELRKADPKRIILAEAAAIGCDTMECLEVSGIRKAAEDAGVDQIIDIKRDKDLIDIPIRDARSSLTKVRLPRFLLEAEHLVNVPIFKSHCSMVFTCALKNIKGVVQDKVHYQMHQTNLAEAMIDLNSVVKPDLTIADLIRPAEGFGPHAAMPTDFGCLAASRDPVALDVTISRMVGLDPAQVPYFEPARDRGFGNSDEEGIEIRGKTIQEVFKPLWLPYLDREAWGDYDIRSEGACSSCLGLLGLAMERLRPLNEYEKNKDITLLVGRKKEADVPEGIDPGKLILMGDCLKKYRSRGIFVEGCPPAEPLPHQAIIDRKSGPLVADVARRRDAVEAPAFAEHMRKLKEAWDKKQRRS
jgi:uncharacterized protein (DUF362 family)